MRIRTASKWGAPVAFCLLITIVAFAIQRYASPPGGLELQPIKESDGDPAIHTGSLKYPREAIDRDGYRVRIPGPARRIVSQYPNLFRSMNLRPISMWSIHLRCSLCVTHWL
jgi:hypothetical protein